MDAKLRLHCQRRKAAVVAERDLYVSDWQQVADYVDPYAGRFLRRQQGKQKLPSRAKVINSKATFAARTMGAGFMGGHTSKSRPWFLIKVPGPLAELPDVKAWCDDLTTLIRDTLAKSNFYTALPTFYHSRHLFGVGAMLCDEDKIDVVRFYPRNIGTYAIGLDHRGISDTFWYEFPMSARQIDQKYGEGIGNDHLPRQIRDALTSGKGDQVFSVQSLIEPNPDKRSGMQAAKFRPYRQLYWIDGTDQDGHGCLDQGGHYELPPLSSRWDATGNDAYGTSPALDALGDIKQLQYLEGEKLRIIDLMSKPALAMPDYLRNKGASANPGDRVYVTPMQTQQKIEPIYTPDARGLQAVQLEIDKIEGRVERAFFADLFRMLDALGDRERTAFEISERKEEKIAMLGPALESLTDEVLEPVITRVFGVLQRNGMVPPPPEALDNVPLTIEYTSMLAQAMKAAGLGTIERTIGFVAGLFSATGGQRTDILDKLDFDQSIDEFAERAGSPARIVRSDDAVAEIREQRAQAMKQQQMMAAAPAMNQMAGAIKTAGESVPQEGSALEMLGGALQQ